MSFVVYIGDMVGKKTELAVNIEARKHVFFFFLSSYYYKQVRTTWNTGVDEQWERESVG